MTSSLSAGGGSSLNLGSLAESASPSPPVAPPAQAESPANTWAAAAQAAATLAATRSFLEKLNSSHALNPPRQVELRPSAFAKDIMGAWATEKIPAGVKYGPFLGKWTLEPVNPNFAWEVSQSNNFD